MGGEAIKGRVPTVSIVMPAYGVASSIGRAIGCVRAQTFADWELIVVDDASPDGSGEIARRHAGNDARIRVVAHDDNRGLSAARNTGIAHAQGTWVWMPDPDDAYDPTLLADAIAAAADLHRVPDAIIFGYVEEFYDADGSFLYANRRPMDRAAYARADDWHRLVIGFERATHYGYAWNKLYRLERIRSLGLSFERVRLIEDVVFNIAYFDSAGPLVVLGGTPYHYVKREGTSLTNANDYGASEYWHLHERRILLLRNQLAGWGVLGAAAPALGSLYVRFIVSALERSYHPVERWDDRRRRAWLAGVERTTLFEELVPPAEAEGSRVLALAIHALRGGHDRRVIAIARVAHLARAHAYGLFTKMRSGR